MRLRRRRGFRLTVLTGFVAQMPTLATIACSTCSKARNDTQQRHLSDFVWNAAGTFDGQLFIQSRHVMSRTIYVAIS